MYTFFLFRFKIFYKNFLIFSPPTTKHKDDGHKTVSNYNKQIHVNYFNKKEVKGENRVRLQKHNENWLYLVTAIGFYIYRNFLNFISSLKLRLLQPQF